MPLAFAYREIYRPPGVRRLADLRFAGPAGGFLFGLLNAGDPDPNPVGRVFYAFMMAALTPLRAGFPANNKPGAGQSFNAWPHIVISYLLIFGWFLYRDCKSSTRRNEQKA